LSDAREKVDNLETALKEVKYEFREYRIENDNHKKENARLDEEN